MPNNYLHIKRCFKGLVSGFVICAMFVNFYGCEPWDLEKLTHIDYSIEVLVDTINIDSNKLEVSGKYNITPPLSNIQIESFGHCYSINNSLPTTSDNKTSFAFTPQSTNPFSSQITGLLPCTKYFIRAYAIINDSTYYSNSIEMMTLNHIQNTWIQLPNFEGTLRYFATGFSIETDGYLGLGSNHTNWLDDFWQYNSISNEWTPITPYPGGGRSEMISFSSSNGKGYVGFGNQTSYYFDLWEYDPGTNQWAIQPNFPGGNKSAVYGFCIGSKAYILINDGSGCELEQLEVWEFDTVEKVWDKKSNFPGVARKYPTGFVVNGKGYFGTGLQCINQSLLKDFWEYNPSTDAWVQKRDFGGISRSNAIAFTINDKGYLGTGHLSTGEDNTFWEYDPFTNNWIQMANVGSIGRSYAVGFSIGHKGYVVTGTNNSGFDTKDFWVFQ